MKRTLFILAMALFASSASAAPRHYVEVTSTFELAEFSCGDEPWGDADAFPEWKACVVDPASERFDYVAFSEIVEATGGTWIWIDGSNSYLYELGANCSEICATNLNRISRLIGKTYSSRRELARIVEIEIEQEKNKTQRLGKGMLP